VLAFVRTSATERALVVHNLSNSTATAGPFDVSASALETIYADNGVSTPSGATGAWTIVLPPHTSGAWRAH
jgi:alpha-amylase